MTPLMKAATAPNNRGLLCAEQLLKVGADPALSGYEQKTAMHFAALSNNQQVMQLLHKHNEQLINLQTKRGDTPLMWAAALNNSDAVKMLIDLGADLNIRDRAGKTAGQKAKDFQSWSAYLKIGEALQ
jgi:ankyrin repeat protein